MTVPSIVTGNSITVLVGGKTLVAKTGHPNFEAIREALKAGAADTAHLASLFDIPKAIEAKSEGAVVVRGNEVLYQGQPLHNTLTERMLQMLGEGFDISPLALFLGKLMRNPSFRAVNGLYDFLAATNIPITPEGDFLAFKKVRGDYLDIHSGTIRNAVGDEPRVPRNQVDEDPERTCSYGLHVCSESYLPHFGSTAGDRVVVVQVDPADVVAIPADYNNAKMRVAGYKVVGEVEQTEAMRAFTAPVMSADDFDGEDTYDTFGDFLDDLEDDEDFLTDEPTEVVKDVFGVPVKFENDDDRWYAIWTDPDGDEVEDLMVTANTLDEAVEEFRDNYLEIVEDWAAEVRWLDDDGELVVDTVVVASTDGEPDEAAFIDALIERGIDVPFDAKVVKIRTVEGSARYRGGYA